ncbi:hypothetical protein LMG28138_05440 [Pararobbsia alpina]|uniref:Uncharacterized protein n=1 Tax=Pararobbsia alpina TaxID=621374 RepID=A0A6S7D217_9BURK|nr:hypothetical protein LMG28138_05440 [Pararobbsia alpina]
MNDGTHRDDRGNRNGTFGPKRTKKGVGLTQTRKMSLNVRDFIGTGFERFGSNVFRAIVTAFEKAP